MRVGRLVLGSALLGIFAGTLILWANVEFRRHGMLVAEFFWLFLLVGLPAGIGSAYTFWRGLRAG